VIACTIVFASIYRGNFSFSSFWRAVASEEEALAETES